ncbi:MAG: glutamate--tRNA ligase [Saprospiraceae bacterium]|nr:glutamate--tRNA ligase [Saprospiraceae bacterium]
MTQNKPVRVRFAPSPTGALHIGGVRTALYNMLFARQQGGTFILRIEDTDQNRYVPGAEAYILEALAWCGIVPDEGPNHGGEVGPYRQSERKDLYRQYAEQLVASGQAYYAFDREQDLDAMRERLKQAGNQAPQYDHRIRMDMRNSLSMDPEDVTYRMNEGEDFIIRLKIDPGQEIHVQDEIRGDVVFRSDELDDKVLLKTDGMPTYHLANIVDDHLMGITHVIRGEEWLPSTAHHVLLYRGLGWEDTMPAFAHLPLIMKPDGKGKLSKRDGARFGMPVFPLSWQGESEEDSFVGFRETGFDPRAVVNFLAFLGWNPGTEQEIFSIEELIKAFSIDRIHKSGARFDFDKAQWYNQQYLQSTPSHELAKQITPLVEANGWQSDLTFLAKVCDLMKERVSYTLEIPTQGSYFFTDVEAYDEAMVRKRWKPESRTHLEAIMTQLTSRDDFSTEELENLVKQYLEENQIGFGAVLPLFRLALAGTMKGPGVFEMMEVLGKERSLARLKKAMGDFDRICG